MQRENHYLQRLRHQFRSTRPPSFTNITSLPQVAAPLYYIPTSVPTWTLHKATTPTPPFRPIPTNHQQPQESLNEEESFVPDWMAVMPVVPTPQISHLSASVYVPRVASRTTTEHIKRLHTFPSSSSSSSFIREDHGTKRLRPFTEERSTLA